METEKGYFILEWRIENLSHWCAKVHGECIRWIAPPNFDSNFSTIELYPKGISGQGEHIVVRLCGVKNSSYSEFSFHSSDGSLLCKQPMNAESNKKVLELLLGPKLEDVLSRIQESGDFITVSWSMKTWLQCYEQHIRTTINVFKISLKIKPSWIEKMGSEGIVEMFHISFSPDNYYDVMKLEAYLMDSIVLFMITPTTFIEYPFAIELCMSSTRSDGTVDNCVKKEHVFHDYSPWVFPDPLVKKELAGEEISLLLCLKTKNLIQNHYYINWDHSNVSIELNNTICLAEKAPSTNPVTSSKVEVLTNDSGSQTSLTSDMPDDSVLVLSKDLMCLYQDQDLSDITLKCDNVTFPVHKVILSARSPVFKTMLSTDMSEVTSGEVVIGDLDLSTLSRFLTHLYTGTVKEELQDDRAFKLYYAADKYQVPSLKKECSKFLCSNVSISNVCDVLSLADRHQDDELTAASHDFILDNYNDVLKSKEWASFMSSDPLLAVKTVTHFATKDRVRMHDPQ